MMIAQGSRIGLRTWQPDDLPVWIALNQDPQVRAYFPNCLTAQEAEEEISRFQDHAQVHGFTLWAVVALDSNVLLGMTGLWRTTFQAAFTPCVEVAWRFAASAWGCGYATEAAHLALQCGFEQYQQPEIFAFTALENCRSVALMQRLGLQYCGMFSHPALPLTHRLSRHVLYRAVAP